MKYRIIEAETKNHYKEDAKIYILQRTRLFGGWKTIYSSEYHTTILEKFYQYTSDKRPLDKVIMVNE